MALAIVTSGCLGGAGQALFDCDTLDVETFTPPLDPDGRLARASGEPVPLIVWADNVGSAELFVSAETQPSVGDVVASSLPMDDDPLEAGILEPGERWFLVLDVADTLDNGSIQLTVRTSGTGGAEDLTCDLDTEEHRWFDAGDPQDAPRAEGGKGVLVRTVGWWTNGSSFYTNMERYHADPGTPGGYLDPYNGSDPLPVYVYNESASEMPDRYNESGYVTTIEGFNAALHGLPTAGGRVTHMPAEQGYTKDGYEQHPLYGDDLIFYIEATEVTTEPCEVPQPVCTLPGADDVPPVPPPGHG